MTKIDNLAFWDKVSQPAGEGVLKPIIGGRLGKARMTDINPVWRFKVMTENFGPCGTGWKYTIEDLWTVEGAEGNLMVFAKVNLFVRESKHDLPPYIWSEAIPGIGGSKLVAKEKDGLYSDDEGYKKAVTDALGTALKMLGVGADVYMGRWDGTKYKDAPKVAVTKRKNKSDNQLVYEAMDGADKEVAESYASQIIDLFASDENELEVTDNKEKAVDILFNVDSDMKQATFWMLKEQSSIRTYIQDATTERWKQIELAKDVPQ